MSDREMIRATLIELIEHDTGEQYDHLEDATKLRDGLGLDSVDVVSVVSQVERRFRVRLSQDELMTLVTVGDFLDLVQSKISQPPLSAAA
jgi:acyl carrier protein